MTGKINDILCRIDEFLGWLSEKLRSEYAEIETSRTPISRKGGGGVQKFVRRNNMRTEVWLCNHSDVNMKIGFTDDIGELDYSMSIAPGDTGIISAQNFSKQYKRDIYGFWDENPQDDTICMVTEFYISHSQ